MATDAQAAEAFYSSARGAVTARVLRMGRNLVFGEVELFDEDGKMAVHATSTYALVS